MSVSTHRSQIRKAALAEATMSKAAGIGDAVDQARSALSYQLPDKVRGAYTYARLVDPANIAALAGLIGGARMIGGAFVPDKERSAAGRVAQGVAGAGLAAGGIYAASDDKARSAIRQAVFGLLGKVGRKTAEAVPAPQDDAYLAGFRKAAESAGADPDALYKQAQTWLRLGARGLGYAVGRGRLIARRAEQLRAARGAGAAAPQYPLVPAGTRAVTQVSGATPPRYPVVPASAAGNGGALVPRGSTAVQRGARRVAGAAGAARPMQEVYGYSRSPFAGEAVGATGASAPAGQGIAAAPASASGAANGQGWLNRYWELLTGGNAQRLAPYTAATGRMDAMEDRLAAYSKALRGYPSRHMRDATVAFANRSAANADQHLATVRAMLNKTRQVEGAEDELRKVLATRLGTGAAAGGTLYGVGSALSGD